MTDRAEKIIDILLADIARLETENERLKADKSKLVDIMNANDASFNDFRRAVENAIGMDIGNSAKIVLAELKKRLEVATCE